MKKLIALLFTTVVSVALFAQNLPAFTESDNAYVFDAKKLDDDYEDNCKVINLSFEENLSFDVYVMKSNKKQWLLAGTATVNGILDACVLESKYDGDYDDYRYFALVPKDNRKYDVTFTCDSIFLYAFFKEACVFLVDIPGATTPDKYKKNATIIDSKSIKGKFKDNIKLINKSSDSNIDFLIFGFDEEGAEKWNAVGKSDLKEYDDSDTMDAPLNNSDDKKIYNYYAIYATNGKKYDVSATKSHNDLYIEIK